MERDSLQSIKLELTKSLSFSPYLRICLHPVIASSHSQIAYALLCSELQAEPAIRLSCIYTIVHYNIKGFTQHFHALLGQSITDEEIIAICSYLKVFGNVDSTAVLNNYVMHHYADESHHNAIIECLDTIRIVHQQDITLLTTLKTILNDTSAHPIIRYYALRALALYHDIKVLLPFLNQDESTLTGILDAIAFIGEDIIDTNKEKDSTPDDSNLVIELRVFLSKLLPQFGEYSLKTKIACIHALILCKHRETNEYLMKILTSDNESEKEHLLILLQHFITQLRDPEPFIRTLISLGAVTPHHNKMIIENVLTFFTTLQTDRTSTILKDKMFNYFTVSLDSFFELYRKNYMISEVEEKNLPENVQKIRNFIVSELTPQLLNMIVHYLKYNKNTEIATILTPITNHIQHIDSSSREGFLLLMEMLYDSDPKSREISASRLETIDFEKRFLRDRIVRLCAIIAKLNIQSAAPLLVKIYNYCKKYRDDVIFDACINTLAAMQYPYMLGELELMLLSGDAKEQLFALNYFIHYKDEHASAILFELLKNTPNGDEVIQIALNLLTTMQIAQFKGSTEILKNIVQTYTSNSIKKSAILCIGHCGEEKDIEWLIEIFNATNDTPLKESIIQAISSIIPRLRDFNKRSIIHFLLDCLKESAIRVRMYACAVLLQLNNKDVENYIKEMLIIKNKDIQSEILFIFNTIKLPEFSFFLLSLLKEEYAIASETIHCLHNLPSEISDEIANFIGNIYKKNGVDISSASPEAITIKHGKIDGLKKHYIMKITIPQESSPETLEETVNKRDTLHSLIINHCKNNTVHIKYILPHSIVAYSDNAMNIANACIAMEHDIKQFNQHATNLFNAIIQCYDAVVMEFGQDFIILTMDRYTHDTLYNYGIIDDGLYTSIQNDYSCNSLPYILASPEYIPIYYIANKKNALFEAQRALDEIIVMEKTKKEKEHLLAEEIRKRKLHIQSQGTTEYIETLEKVNAILRSEINEINKYVQKRSADRELNTQLLKMLENMQKKIFLEISSFMMK